MLWCLCLCGTGGRRLRPEDPLAEEPRRVRRAARTGGPGGGRLLRLLVRRWVTITRTAAPAGGATLAPDKGGGRRFSHPQQAGQEEGFLFLSQVSSEDGRACALHQCMLARPPVGRPRRPPTPGHVRHIGHRRPREQKQQQQHHTRTLSCPFLLSLCRSQACQGQAPGNRDTHASRSRAWAPTTVSDMHASITGTCV